MTWHAIRAQLESGWFHRPVSPLSTHHRLSRVWLVDTMSWRVLLFAFVLNHVDMVSILVSDIVMLLSWQATTLMVNISTLSALLVGRLKSRVFLLAFPTCITT